MKIPKQIEKLIERRTKLAEDLNSVELTLDNWIEEHGGELDDPDICDSVRSGCMLYCEPGNAANKVLKYISEQM